MQCKIYFCFTIFLVLLSVVIGDDAEKEFVNVIDEIDNEKSMRLFGGLSIEKVESATALPSSSADAVLDRVQRYFATHELKFNYPEDEIETARSHGATGAESRTRKLKKILLPLILALKFKLAVVVKVMLLVIKAISLKALVASFLALLFSGASFFKDLMSKKKDHVTTAYITAPVNAEIVHTDWNRNGQPSAQELAYNHYAVPQNNY